MHRHVARSVLACTSILSFQLLSWGQSDTGTITGTVKDTTAAVITRVKITVTDARTNSDLFTAFTDTAGQYTAPALRPSDYVLMAEMAGFKKEGRRCVILQVNPVALIELILLLGQVTVVLA